MNALTPFFYQELQLNKTKLILIGLFTLLAVTFATDRFSKYTGRDDAVIRFSINDDVPIDSSAKPSDQSTLSANDVEGNSELDDNETRRRTLSALHTLRGTSFILFWFVLALVTSMKKEFRHGLWQSYFFSKWSFPQILGLKLLLWGAIASAFYLFLSIGVQSFGVVQVDASLIQGVAMKQLPLRSPWAIFNTPKAINLLFFQIFPALSLGQLWMIVRNSYALSDKRGWVDLCFALSGPFIVLSWIPKLSQVMGEFLFSSTGQSLIVETLVPEMILSGSIFVLLFWGGSCLVAQEMEV